MKTLKSNKKFKFHLNLIDESDSKLPSGNITFIMAFVIPFIIFAALYYARGIFPFDANGQNCYLRSDMYHQYAPFFSELWNKLRTGGSLTYSWDIGMGANFTSLSAYYLASPTNFLCMLFPQKYTVEIMNFFIIIKLSLASSMMAFYLSKHFKTKSFILALFGIFYGLSGYAAAYAWNVMWLDCILLMPIIILGLERLVKENKCLMYAISLGLCIYTNYYISIMVCISIILYFIILMVTYDGPKKTPRVYIKKFVNWCIYSLLAGGLAACFLLPEFYTFSLSASNSISFPKKIEVYFSFLEMMSRQLMDVPVHLGLDHYPNIYCSVAIFVLLPLYIMNKKIDVKEKICKSLLLLAFLLSFNINLFNFIWHGLRYPNSLPARQSYIYVFFLLAMSYEAIHNIKSITKKQLGIAAGISIGLMMLFEALYVSNNTYDAKVIYLSAAFIILYILLIYGFKVIKRGYPILLFLILTVSIVECTINMESTGISTTNRTAYLKDFDAINTCLDMIDEQDTSNFYRVDKLWGIRSKNDGAWHNYKSVGTFSSTSNAALSTLMGKLGFEDSFNAYGCEGSTVLTRSMFSTKYTISNKVITEGPLNHYLLGNDGELIYQNDYTLPLGYMVKSDVNTTWNTSAALDALQVQNSFAESQAGVSSLFTQIYEFNNDLSKTFTPTISGYAYAVCSASTSYDSLGVDINSNSYNFTGMKSGNKIADLGYVTTNDTITLSAESALGIKVYVMDTSKYLQAYNVLNNQGLNITSFKDTDIKGTINATKDGIMMLSIPYDGGWSIYVDGQKATALTIKDALLGVSLSAGEHTIELKYCPVNLVLGWCITIICVLLLALLCIAKHKTANAQLKIKNCPLFIQDLLSYEDLEPVVIETTETAIETDAAPDDNNEINDKGE